jgi:DNA-binding NarL/FixJ family response regulator
MHVQSHSSGSGHDQLSNREIDVLQRIVSGQRLTDIADALHLSVKTVSTHKARIQEKLNTPTMAALIRYGIDHNLSDAIDESPSLQP